MDVALYSSASSPKMNFLYKDYITKIVKTQYGSVFS